MQKDYKIGSILTIIYLAAFYEIIDGYLLTKPRDTIALLGDRIDLDCVTNSSRQVDWRLRSGAGSGKDVWISRGNQTDENISDAFRIRHEEFGQFSLVIDPVLMSFAGRYACDDKDEDAFSVEVTVINRNPSCDKSTVHPSRKILCNFNYSGNLKPKLEWVTMGNSTWNASCSASNDTVDCVFESSCTMILKQSVIANTFLTICPGGNSTCQLDNASSSVGLLRLKDNNKTVGSWHCSSTGVATTTSPIPKEKSKTSSNIQLLLISVGVTSTAIILLLFILRIKYGICRKKGTAHDVLYDRATDQVDPSQTQTETITVASGYVTSEPENSPVYSQVQKKRKAPPKNAVNGHDNLIIENSLYASSKTSGVAKTASEVSRNKFATDDVIYADLRQVPRETSSSRVQRTPMVIREGFDTSTYAFIDHNLRAPALLPK